MEFRQQDFVVSSMSKNLALRDYINLRNTPTYDDRRVLERRQWIRQQPVVVWVPVGDKYVLDSVKIKTIRQEISNQRPVAAKLSAPGAAAGVHKKLRPVCAWVNVQESPGLIEGVVDIDTRWHLTAILTAAWDAWEVRH
jgi:hypothetical protein